MGWLGTRPKRAAQEPQTEEQPVPEAEPKPAGPPLFLLVPYVAGVSSYQTHTFYDAPSAAAFIQESVPAELRRGILAFWALHEPPSDPTLGYGGEALVLIASPEARRQVYVVSFVDIASAQSFARFEVKRGLDPALLSIYWAQLVTVTEGPDGISITPEEPPATKVPAAPAHPPAGRRPRASALPAPEPEAGPELGPVPEASAEEETPPAEPLEEPELDLFAGDEPEITAVPAEAAPAEEPSAAPGALQLEVAEPEVAAPGPEEPATETLSAPAPGPPPPDGDDGEKPPEAEPSTVIEIAKALRVRRWQKREDPFQGFGSPPGRF